MIRTIHVLILVFVAVAGLMSLSASAQTPNEVLAAIKAEAKISNPACHEFSAERGANFNKQKHANELCCAACDTQSPAASGKHAKSGRIIRAIAPAANPENRVCTPLTVKS